MIRTVNLNKVFRSGQTLVQALKDVSLEIEKGECILLKGPSGSGKTTFLNIVGCLARPTKGEIFLEGKEVSYLPDHFLADIRRERIGFVFQAYNLLLGCSVLYNVGVPLLPLGLTAKERERKALPILERIGLKGRVNFRVNELSGGEQQRVSLARALINDPAIILADEPVSNVDQKTAQGIYGLFVELKKEGRTIIVSSHNPFWQAREIFDRVFSLEEGRLLLSNQ